MGIALRFQATRDIRQVVFYCIFFIRKALFPPVFGPVQCLCTDNLAAYTADQTGTEFLHHPRTSMFFRNCVRRFKSENARRSESMTRIIFRMAENKYYFNS